MKFRQLSLNPFHRNRGKTKKKAKKQEYPSKNCQGNVFKDQNDLDRISARSELSDVHQQNLDDLELCRGTIRNPLEPFDDQGQLDVDIKSQYRLDNYFYPLEDVNNLELIDSAIEDKCSCCVQLPGCFDYDKSEVCYDVCIVDSDRANTDIDAYSNTIPKVRSRIKTNPWLPSPKLSPETETGASPTDSLSSTDSNPSDSESNEHDLTSSSEDSLAFGGHSDDFFNLYSGDKKKNDNSVFKRPSNLLLNRGRGNALNSEPLNVAHETVIRRTSKARQNENTDENYRWSIISEGDISIDLNSPTIEDLRERFSNLEHKVSFEYEENVDSALESDSSSKRNSACLSINDLLMDDSSLVDVTTSSTDLAKSMEGSEDHPSDLSSSSCESSCVMTDSSENGGTHSFEFSSSFYSEDSEFPMRQTYNMDDSIDAGYSSLSRDGRISSESDCDSATERKSDILEDNGNSALDCNSENKMLPLTSNKTDSRQNDSEYFFFGNTFPRSSGRALKEVKMSLEEKVNRLRLEKMIVEQKIREAQEAEKIRLQERLRFKKQISTKRKDVLIQTLNNLKEKLEDQSNRLQNNYSAVLNMQRRYSQRRPSFMFVASSHVTTHVA